MTRLELLDVLSGAAQELQLRQPVMVLGRGPDVDWSFDDRAVSRRHAAVHHRPDRDEIEDLGSTAGTIVNGAPVQGRCTLRGGDVLQLGSVRLRYVQEDMGAPTSRQGMDHPAGATFDIDQQRAGVLNNIGHDQHNQYVQQIIVNREDAFRQIASTSRFARALLIGGFPLAVSGVLAFIASGVVDGAMSNPDLSSPQAFAQSTQPAEVAGIPVFALAMGVVLLGMALAFTGLIIQFAASTRRREVDRRYPLPPGWVTRSD